MKINIPTGNQNKTNQELVTDKDKIRHASKELFGNYKISKWELATNWNLSLWNFLFDRNYRETVQGEFYAHLLKEINQTNPLKLPDLHNRIAKIPSDDLGDAIGIDNRNKLLSQIKDFCRNQKIDLNKSE